MASYDKPKLLKMIEQRQQARVALHDLHERYRDAKQVANHLRAVIESAAGHRAMRDGVVDRLMKLSTKEAARLSSAEIQEYTDTAGAVRGTGINVDNYRRYIAARDSSQRLASEHENGRSDFGARFACVGRLVQAVKDWGFTDPELEVF